jgi:hypothetical protein
MDLSRPAWFGDATLPHGDRSDRSHLRQLSLLRRASPDERAVSVSVTASGPQADPIPESVPGGGLRPEDFGPLVPLVVISAAMTSAAMTAMTSAVMSPCAVGRAEMSTTKALSIEMVPTIEWTTTVVITCASAKQQA